ncbi:glycosyltransferase family 4 protein [Pedobacter aquae]|uniref:Glycosyltransferase family 4 protein n=1 Tax=Pedobacter aquae TaxID=2605747 RepID=A0A5C0VGE6_9SPHI|nr:glycosyltransferase family 4 protein [Pedobacter aquae]QEK50340.1 glycosyltransferase family 4 protein [Pedobacter aquae]
MIPKPQKVLFLTLRTFSLTGGIEKVCRGIAFALQNFQQEGKIHFRMISLYDDLADERYVKKMHFKAYGLSPKLGALASCFTAFKYNTIILSHINLAPIACFIKFLKPTCRIILWTHGIEVWRPLKGFKRRLLEVADEIIAVSAFTKSEITKRHAIQAERIKVVPNALDPYFVIPEIKEDDESAIRKLYAIPADAPLFFALTRLKNSEQQKNYDLVIRAIAALKDEGIAAYYMLGGKYEDAEYQRIQDLAISLNIQKQIILTGFIADEAISNYYQAADAFVLPSEKEGFGLVFIEAQACGLRVVAGNQDGSIDAVQNPDAGILVNPRDFKAIQEALKSLSQNKLSIQEKKAIQHACLEKFAYEKFSGEVERLVG